MPDFRCREICHEVEIRVGQVSWDACRYWWFHFMYKLASQQYITDLIYSIHYCRCVPKYLSSIQNGTQKNHKATDFPPIIYDARIDLFR